MKKRSLWLGLACLAAAIPAANAQTTTYDWTETGSSLYGNGSGTVTFDSATFGNAPEGYGFIVTDMTGSFSGGSVINGAPISEPAVLDGTTIGALIAFSGPTASPDSLVGGEIYFAAGGGVYELAGYEEYAPNPSAPFGIYHDLDPISGTGDEADGGGDTLTLSPVGAPEPSTLALSALAAGAMVKFRRRK